MLRKLTIFIVLLLVVTSVSAQELVIENYWATYAMRPASLTAYKAMHIFGEDNLQYSTGSASLNSAVIAECLSATQGTIECWIRPSWNGDDGLNHYIFSIQPSAADWIHFYKLNSSYWYLSYRSNSVTHTSHITSASDIAGSWVHLVVVWDKNNTVDGTNYVVLYKNATTDTVDAVQPGVFGSLSNAVAVGERFDTTYCFNGLIVTRILDRALSAAEVTALYAAGAGSADSFVVTPDTKLLMLTSDDSTSVVYHHFGQKIQSISTVTLTTVDNVTGRWINGDKVLVYDDDDPANNVYTGIDGTPSGSTITVDDSCAAVSGTNKFISRNLVVDPDFETAGVNNITVDANVTPTKDSSTVKFGTQSLKLAYVAADDDESGALPAMTLENGQDYYYRLWTQTPTIDPDTVIDYNIDGAGSIVSREVGKALGDNNQFDRDFNLGGSNTAVAANNTVHDITTEDIGIGIWVNIASSVTDTCTIIDKGAKYRFYINTVGVIVIEINDGSNKYTLQGTTDIRGTGWRYITSIIDRDNADNCEVYLDTVVDTDVKTGTIGDVGSLTTASVFTFGARTGGAWPFIGKARGVVFSYPADIMAAGEMGDTGEIANLYNNPSNPSAWPNSEDYWLCDDNAASTVVTGDNNNLIASANTDTFAETHWKMFEGTFAGDQDGAHTVSFAVTGEGAGANDAEFYCDKMEVLPSLIPDGGMEGVFTSGLNDSWTSYGAGSGWSSEETTDVHSGSKSQKVTASNNNEGFSRTLGVATGYHTVSFFAKVTSGTLQVATLLPSSSMNITGNTWTKYCISFYSEGSTGLWFYSTGAAATFYIDDVSLIRNDTRAALTAIKGPGYYSDQLWDIHE